MKYAYYTGCSLESTAKEYDVSIRAVFAHMGIELLKIEDWNCCGAVHAKGKAAIRLPARNLALAEAMGLNTIVAPCSGCYRNLRRASKAIAADKKVREDVNAHLKGDLQLKGDITVLHPLYVVLYEYGLDKVKALVTHPLTGLKIASYYGCMLTRPKDEFDSPENPKGFDELMKALGAEVIDYPLKAKCCGGALAVSHADVTAKLSGNIMYSAKERGGEIVTLGCPMCHTSLDLYQSKAEKAIGHELNLPILYFTQLMGLAMGLPKESLGLERHIVSPMQKLIQAGF